MRADRPTTTIKVNSSRSPLSVSVSVEIEMPATEFPAQTRRVVEAAQAMAEALVEKTAIGEAHAVVAEIGATDDD